MSDILYLRYFKLRYTRQEVNDRCGSGCLRYDNVNPDHVQTGPLLRGESQSQNLFSGPKILC